VQTLLVVNINTSDTEEGSRARFFTTKRLAKVGGGVNILP
jgi:hypothetical protein